MKSVKTSFLTRNFSIRASALAMMFLLCNLFLNAQSPGLSLGNVGVCNSTTVLVPLTGNNLANVGALTLFINYDDQSLSFSSIENIDPQLNGLMFNVLSNPSRVAIVWSKTSGASFMNTTLLNLKFDVLQQAGNLSFIKDNCEIANISLPPQIIAVDYTNGSFFEAKPTISSEPENKTASSQSDVVFQVASPDAAVYMWQESRNDGILWTTLPETNTYTGTHTNTMMVRQVPATYNHFMYRCILNPYNCFAVSASAILTVDSISGIAGQPSRSVLHLNNSPNPFSLSTTLEYTVPENGFVTIKIFSMTGKTMGIPVERLHTAGTYRIEDNFVDLPVGLYFCQYVFKGKASMYETYRKMIKINQK